MLQSLALRVSLKLVPLIQVRKNFPNSQSNLDPAGTPKLAEKRAIRLLGYDGGGKIPFARKTDALTKSADYSALGKRLGFLSFSRVSIGCPDRNVKNGSSAVSRTRAAERVQSCLQNAPRSGRGGEGRGEGRPAPSIRLGLNSFPSLRQRLFFTSDLGKKWVGPLGAEVAVHCGFA